MKKSLRFPIAALSSFVVAYITLRFLVTDSCLDIGGKIVEPWLYCATGFGGVAKWYHGLVGMPALISLFVFVMVFFVLLRLITVDRGADS